MCRGGASRDGEEDDWKERLRLIRLQRLRDDFNQDAIGWLVVRAGHVGVGQSSSFSPMVGIVSTVWCHEMYLSVPASSDPGGGCLGKILSKVKILSFRAL